MENKILDDHSAFNRWQVVEGMRVNESDTKLSVYITEIKLKKAFKLISDEDIENLYGKEMNEVAIKKHRKLLNEKMERLHEWQLFFAFSIWFEEHDTYQCAQYILSCKYSDRKR